MEKLDHIVFGGRKIPLPQLFYLIEDAEPDVHFVV